MSNFIDNAGNNGEEARMPQTFIQEEDTVKHKTFVESYLKAFNPSNGRIPSPSQAAQGYDSVYLLVAAIKQAGTTAGPAVRAALEDLKDKVEGVITTYDRPFTHDDHEAIKLGTPFLGQVSNGWVIRAK
jgi:branched-chain amino acid transport system substrate-binding protein